MRALLGLLDARRRAVLGHDPAAWLGTVDRRSPQFRSRQAAVFANLRSVPFSDWSYRYVGPAASLPAARVRQLGGRAWVARVLVGHRLRGYDTATSYSEQFLTVVDRGGSGWLLAADTDGSGAPQPWDLGPVHVARGSRVLVLGTGSAADLRAYAVAGDRAVGQVSAVWGNAWPRRAVLVLPRTQAEFGRLLLRGPQGLDQVAAVTVGDLAQAADARPTAAGPVPGAAAHSAAGRALPPAAVWTSTSLREAAAQMTGSTTDARPAPAPPALRRNDRVVLNPGAFDRLGPVGRRVVLTHELTHVAVRSSTTASVPIWLSEGMADYVAYKGTGVPLRTSTADVLAEVRRGRGPATLPDNADFDPARTAIAPAYSASLLACQLVAQRYGERALVRLYRTAASPSGRPGTSPEARLTRAFPRALGVSEPRFTADWRRYLVRIAR